jgi:hypothetical protein
MADLLNLPERFGQWQRAITPVTGAAWACGQRCVGARIKLR